MKTVLLIVLASLAYAASPAAAQAPCIDLCAILPNCGFDAAFAHWTCTRPNANYKCPPSAGPRLDVPAAISPGPDDPFVGVLNPADQDVAGKLVHEAVALPWTSEGTCVQVKVWANRGRLPNPFAPFTGAPSEVRVRLFGWTYGARPVISAATDDWSRNPDALNCSLLFPFPGAGSEGSWRGQVLQCAATQELEWVSISIAAINHSHNTYAAFDLTEADFVP